MSYCGAETGSCNLKKKQLVYMFNWTKRGQSFVKPRVPNGTPKVNYNNQNISRDVVPLK
jgi:hypothetical protein